MAAQTVTVSQLNNYIKRVFDTLTPLADIWVSGELSNVKRHFSGHIYMTLKDDASTLRTVMFKGDTFSLRFLPENGMKVLIRGRVSVYERDGQYQLYAKEILPDGVGALYTAYEQLKARLEEEGLFSPAFKKQIPLFPQKIGVVTAKTGAAVRDILNILNRRYPIAEVTVFPVLVQGSGAAEQISKMLDYINEKHLADVIIVGRGGGSIEDLWAFNEEAVARAVFRSEIPVISAVGHETDFTICDFAADLRAPTPSAAAELAVPSKDELNSRLAAINSSMKSALLYAVSANEAKLNRLNDSLKPEKLRLLLNNAEEKLLSLTLSLKRAQNNLITQKETELKTKTVRLNSQNPLNLLLKGFCVAKTNGKILKSKNNVNAGDVVELTLSDGNVSCNVNEIF